MINQIKAIGEKVNIKWKQTGFDRDSFSKIALKELESFHLDIDLENLEAELAKWLCENELPGQVNVYNTFGQPPVTVFNNGDFVVDLYFWMHVDTSIHDHSFSGAFKVLAGRSLHEKFNVTSLERFSDDVMKSDVSLVDNKILNQGDSHEIIRGSSFNHRLIHIDAPTVTLCVRTVNDKTSSQWHHFSNGLSIHKKEMSQDVIKSLYYWQYLCLRNDDNAASFIDKKINSWTISQNLNLYEQLSIDQMNLEDELVEYIFNLIGYMYQNEQWFKLYNDFCQNALGHKTIDREESIYRLFEHFINNNYDALKSKSILESLLKRELNNEEQSYLELRNI